MQCNISRYISALMLVIFILVVMCYASIYQLRTSSLTVWKFDAVFTFFLFVYVYVFKNTTLEPFEISSVPSPNSVALS